MPKQRLFLSFLPENDILTELKSAQDELKLQLDNQLIKWEDPGKFHLTLRFLGDIIEDNIEPLITTLDRLKFEFENIYFKTEKIDFFPNKRYPNIIFAGLKEKGNNTDTLIGFIDKIIYNFGVVPDKKFIPHVTLGRFSRRNRKKVNGNFEFKLKEQTVKFDAFSLMRSKLQPGGTEYEIISKFNFLK